MQITENGLILIDPSITSSVDGGPYTFIMSYAEEATPDDTRGFAGVLYRDTNGVTVMDWSAGKSNTLESQDQIYLGEPEAINAALDPQALARWIAHKLKKALTRNDGF